MSQIDSQATIEAAAIGLTSLLRTQYNQSVPDNVHMHGNPIARRIKPGRIVPSSGANGGEGGWEFQVKTGRADQVRSVSDMSGDFRAPKKSIADKLRVRFNPFNSSANDINRIDTQARVHVADLKRAANDPGVAINIVENAVRDATQGIDQTLEVLMHSDRSAAIGVLNGTKKNNSSNIYSTATTYTNGSTTARIKITDFSIAVYKRNSIIDIYSAGGTLLANDLQIVDVNEEDFSIGVRTTAETSAANLDALADAAVIYRSGEKGAGFKGSLGELFKESYAGDTGWFGDKDRSAIDNTHYIPMRTRVGAASAKLSNRIVDRLARSNGYRRGSSEPNRRPTIIIGMEAFDNWRYSVADGVTLNQPAVNDGKLQEGSDGLTWVHPAVGRVDIISTLTARNDRLYMIYPEDWEMLAGDVQGLQYLSGTTANMWERVPGTNTHGGGSVYYRMEALSYLAPFCQMLDSQAVAFNVE